MINNKYKYYFYICGFVANVNPIIIESNLEFLEKYKMEVEKQ